MAKPSSKQLGSGAAAMAGKKIEQRKKTHDQKMAEIFGKMNYGGKKKK